MYRHGGGIITPRRELMWGGGGFTGRQHAVVLSHHRRRNLDLWPRMDTRNTTERSTRSCNDIVAPLYKLHSVPVLPLPTPHTTPHPSIPPDNGGFVWWNTMVSQYRRAESVFPQDRASQIPGPPDTYSTTPYVRTCLQHSQKHGTSGSS